MIQCKLLGNHMRQLDTFEQVVVLALYVWLLLRLWSGVSSEVTLAVPLLLLSEGIVAVFVLIRKPTETVSTNIGDWFIAFSATLFPLLVSRGGESQMLYVGLFIMIFGFITHVGAKLSLFRSFGIVPANRGVKVKGLYAVVRHPMYAGYFLTHIGYLLSAPSIWNLGVYACTWGFLILRIFAEEKILLRSPDYQRYKELVSYRLFPGLF